MGMESQNRPFHSQAWAPLTEDCYKHSLALPSNQTWLQIKSPKHFFRVVVGIWACNGWPITYSNKFWVWRSDKCNAQSPLKSSRDPAQGECRSSLSIKVTATDLPITTTPPFLVVTHGAQCLAAMGRITFWSLHWPSNAGAQPFNLLGFKKWRWHAGGVFCEVNKHVEPCLEHGD